MAENGGVITNIAAYMSTMRAYRPPEPGPRDLATPTEMTVDFERNMNEPYPYIYSLIKYENDGIEGYIHFDGYYYVYDGSEDEDAKTNYGYAERCLPKRLTMNVVVRETVPYHTYKSSSWYRTVSHEAYEVEVYRREKIKNTNKYSPDDEYGSICFFSTDEQKIYFRVLCHLSRVA